MHEHKFLSSVNPKQAYHVFFQLDEYRFHFLTLICQRGKISKMNNLLTYN